MPYWRLQNVLTWLQRSMPWKYCQFLLIWLAFPSAFFLQDHHRPVIKPLYVALVGPFWFFSQSYFFENLGVLIPSLLSTARLSWQEATSLLAGKQGKENGQTSEAIKSQHK